MAPPLAVLIIEDSEKDATLMLREIRKAGWDVEYERVASAVQLANALERRRWDIVLSDYNLPGFDARRALRMVKERDPDLPFIVVSGAVGEETAVEAMRAGAQDYVMKDRLVRLSLAVRREVRDAEIRRAQARASRRLTLQHEVTRVLAEARTPEDAVRDVLRTVIEHLRWDAGSFWRPEGDVARCQAAIRSDRVGASDFEARTGEYAFRRGEGLIGRVWERQAPEWIPDVALDPTYKRRPLAVAAGLHSAYALPVFVDNELYGVLDFLNHDPAPPDPGLPETLFSIGTQLGQSVRRAHALAALEESEAHKAAILEAAADAIVSTDHRGVVLEWNPAAERMFGYSRAEAVGRALFDLLLPAEERAAFAEGVRRYVQEHDGTPKADRFRLRLRCKDGHELPVEVAVSRIGTEEPPEFTAYIRDVTEDERRDRNQRLLTTASATLSRSLDFPKVLDRVARLPVPALADGCVVQVGEDSAVPQDTAVAHVDGDKEARARSRLEQLGWEATEAQEVMRSERRRAYPDPGTCGREVPLDANAPPLLKELGARAHLSLPLFARGRVLGVLTLFYQQPERCYDASDIEVAEDLARRAAFAIDNARLYQEARESVRARDEFLSLAAHELKTPLTPLRLLLQSLSRTISRADGQLRPEQLLSRLEVILHAVRRLENLVEGLLDISRMTIGPLELEPREVDLGETVRHVIEGMRDQVRSSGSRLELHLEEGVAGDWDHDRIEQVVRNLLSNAIKYGAGKPVEVRVESVGERARMCVRDYGIGVSLAEQARIFERFGRAAPLRNYGGFGLGLWTARQIVDAHGGSIRIESTPGEGARFIVELPLRREGRRQGRPGAPPPPPAP